MKSLQPIKEKADTIALEAKEISEELGKITIEADMPQIVMGIDPFIFAITVFVLSCFIGYYVIWKVTPALHTPLMSVTNAISAIIIVGAILALGAEGGFGVAKFFGFLALVLASINLFGGFVVTHRMLEMFRKK